MRHTKAPSPGLMTTYEVAALLRVHPKHVYRLLKRGLPARRVGDEWRFAEADVLAWSAGRMTALESADEASAGRPPLLAANGDLAVEALFDEARDAGAPIVGFVQADHATGIESLQRGAVIAAGCHGSMPVVPGEKLVRIHLVTRELGLAHRRGQRIRRVSSVAGKRLAGRPTTAGIRRHMDQALLREGVDLEEAYSHAEEHPSHREAVMAVVRGDAEIALASGAWAAHAGLGAMTIANEAYGLVVRALDMSDPRVIALIEVAQSKRYRARLAQHAGYDASRAGAVHMSTENNA